MTIKEYEAKLKEIDPPFDGTFESWKVKRIDKQCLALMYNDFLDLLISDFGNPDKTQIIPADGSKFFHLKSLKAVGERISLTAEFVEHYED